MPPDTPSGTLYALPETRSLRTLLQPLLQSPTPR